MSGKFASTLGFERRRNQALLIKDRETFIRYMVEGQPRRPANVGEIAAINQGRLPLTMTEPVAPALLPAEVSRCLDECSDLRVIDTREPAAFGAAHIPGAVNVQLSSPEFEQRIGWTMGTRTEFLLVTENDEDVRLALNKMGFLGLDRRVQGHLSGGMRHWIGQGFRHETVSQISVHQLHGCLQGGGEAYKVLDVREDEEWSAGHIDGARHMNFKLMGEDAEDFPYFREESIALVCAAGMRSSTGASLLLRHGFSKIYNVTGGMGAWRAAGYEVV